MLFKQREFCVKALASPILLLLVSACFGCNPKPTSATECVLSEGMKISADTPSGNIVIEGKEGFSRLYSGDGWSIRSTLMPRTSRWYGSFGLYDPAGGFTRFGRLIVDEGRQFFSSESEALRYMQSLSGYFGALTYNNSGLVIAYKVIDMKGGEPTRAIEVWQFYIKGKQPSSMRGADDSRIRVEGGIIPKSAHPFPANIGFERELADNEYKYPGGV